jgi:hypothetical protein
MGSNSFEKTVLAMLLGMVFKGFEEKREQDHA